MDAIDMLKLYNEDRKLFDKASNKLSSSETFTNQDLRIFLTKANEVNLIDKNREIPLRKALVIIYEEYLQRNGAERGDYKYDFIYKIARVRFSFTQRSKTRFPTLEIAHPEYPCRAYEELPRRKFYYKKTLEEILANACWLLEDDKAEASLHRIYNEVKYC